MPHDTVILSDSSTWQPKFDRWVDLREFDFGMRYKSVDDSNSVHEFNNGQQRGIIDGKFKFDEQVKYGIDFHASSGRSFNWGFADFIGGGNQKALTLEAAGSTAIQQPVLGLIFQYLDPVQVKASYNSGGWAFYVRRLALDVEPVKGVELEYGGLDIDRGLSTEITTYDNDGYISGERLLIKKPRQFLFDEASVTYAYLGDFNTPNFFVRGTRLKQSNYHQFLLRKQVGKRFDASVDYTFQDKGSIMHEAALIDVHESRVFDTLRPELYQRLNTMGFPDSPALVGFAITADRKVSRHISLEGGYAQIDGSDSVRAQSVLSSIIGLDVNGDQFGVGKRLFVRPTVKLTPYLEASCFYTRQFTTSFSSPYTIIWNQQAFNIGFNFDMKKAFFQAKDK